jgi:hypothetical protein
MHGFRLSLVALSLVLATLLPGCEKSKALIDDAALRQTIERYLDAHNMALSVKEIKEQTLSADRELQIKASLVHRELKGPSVTWTFLLQQQPNGQWQVLRHKD